MPLRQACHRPHPKTQTHAMLYSLSACSAARVVRKIDSISRATDSRHCKRDCFSRVIRHTAENTDKRQHNYTPSNLHIHEPLFSAKTVKSQKIQETGQIQHVLLHIMENLTAQLHKKKPPEDILRGPWNNRAIAISAFGQRTSTVRLLLRMQEKLTARAPVPQ